MNPSVKSRMAGMILQPTEDDVMTALEQSWATRRKGLVQPTAVDAGGPVFNASGNTIGVTGRWSFFSHENRHTKSEENEV